MKKFIPKLQTKFEDLAGGGVAEAFDHALQEVLQNIADPNMDITKKRKLNLELIFIPDSRRRTVHVRFSTKTKLEMPMPLETTLAVDNTGESIYSRDLQAKEANPNQLVIDVVKVTADGEVVGENTVISDNVKDLREYAKQMEAK